jgi:hypothetical protein
MVVSGQRHAPAVLYPRRKDFGTNWIGDWVGLSAGLDETLEEKSFASAGDRTTAVQSVVRHFRQKCWPKLVLKISNKYAFLS